MAQSKWSPETPTMHSFQLTRIAVLSIAILGADPDPTAVDVPEPSTFALAAGCLALIAARRRRR
jgi:hypothetical protein